MKKIKSYVKNYLKQVDENGFSLLELVVAVGVLLVLTVGGLLAYNGITKNARMAAVQSAADEVYTGAVAYDSNGEVYTQAATDWMETSKKGNDSSITVEVGEKNPDGSFCVVAEMKNHPGITASKGSGCEGSTGGSENGGETTPPIIGGDDEEDENVIVDLPVVAGDLSSDEYPSWMFEGSVNSSENYPVGTVVSVSTWAGNSVMEDGHLNKLGVSGSLSNYEIVDDMYANGLLEMSGYWESIPADSDKFQVVITLPDGYSFYNGGTYTYSQDMDWGGSTRFDNDADKNEEESADSNTGGGENTGPGDTNPGGSESVVMDVEFNFGFDFGMTDGYYEGQSFEWSLVRLSDDKVVKSGNMSVDSDYVHINAVDIVEFDEGVSPVLSDYKIIIDGRESVIRSNSSNMKQSGSGDRIVYDYNYVGDWGGSIS